MDRQAWKCYLKGLPNDDARKFAKEMFQKIAKEVHIEKSQQAKERKRKAKKDALARLEECCKGNQNFHLLYNKAVELFADALKMDKDTISSGRGLKTDALVAKWAPRIGGSIDNATLLGKAVARKLYRSKMEENSENTASPMDDEQFNERAFAYYRKHYITPLREHIKIPEKFMSAKKWNEIDYQRVSSVCMKRNKKHFVKRDPDRFNQFLQDVQAGKKKIASGSLLPHEIVGNFMKDCSEASEIDEVSNLQWRSYVDNLKKSGTLKSALSVCDVSGSMEGTPMQVAIALSLLTSEVSEPPFNQFICTFSEKPTLIPVNQETLKEKIAVVKNMPWGMNTDFQAVFDLILNLAKKTQLSPEEMVKTVFVYSDMEFDCACGNSYDYQLIKRKFTEAGYPMPGMVFWNLRGNLAKPVTKNDTNVALVSGYSGQMLKSFLENGELTNPFQVMLTILGDRYDHLLVVD